MNIIDYIMIPVIPIAVLVTVKILLMAGRFCSMNDINSQEDSRRLRSINEYNNRHVPAKKKAG